MVNRHDIKKIKLINASKLNIFNQKCNFVNFFFSKVRMDDAYIFLFPLGFLGLHHFYLRRYGWGILYLCTVGIFGIGWLSDFCRLPTLVAEYNREVERVRLIQSECHIVLLPTMSCIWLIYRDILSWKYFFILTGPMYYE